MENIWPKFGHDEQSKMLENEIKNNRVFHAYLFLGPDKIGKFTVAKSFAASMQSDMGKDENTLKNVMGENEIDTFFTKDNGKSIKVEEVREMLGNLATSPQGRYKIWLIQGANRLTIGAANALLKSLEEPNPNTVFIFTATHTSDLPATIVSRMRLVRFQNIPTDVLVADLQKHYPQKGEEEIRMALKLSLGKPGRSMHLLENEIEFEDERANYMELKKLILEAPTHVRFKFAEKLLKEVDEANKGDDSLGASHILQKFFEDMQNILRSEMLEGLDKSKIELIEQVGLAQKLIGMNINKRLVLENMFLHFA